jgi:hypothetical protein
MKLIVFLLMVFAASPALACNRCGRFMKCGVKLDFLLLSASAPVDYAPVPVIQNKVDVQFRHLRFVDQRKQPTQEEINTALAYQRQWEMVTSAIPISPPIDQNQLFKLFRFQNNLPSYQAPKLRR